MPPRITSRGFIKGTVTPRIRTYSDPDNLKADLSTFKAKLTERGYKHNEIEHCFEKAPQFDRKKLLEDRPRNKEVSLVYITKYNPTSKI